MSIFRRVPQGRSSSAASPGAVAPTNQPTQLTAASPHTQLGGHETLEVVGESFYQDNLWKLVRRPSDPAQKVRSRITAVLIAEPNNPHDANAIAIWIGGLKVGHLSRDDARRYRPGLLALQHRHRTQIALAGVISGGGIRSDGPGRLGVFLDHNPADFGLGRTQPTQNYDLKESPGSPATLSGGSGDASYMSWISELPVDDMRAISVLRKLLGEQADPLSRHFIYQHLEARLYGARDVFASALSEYDEACRRHDAEMDGIRKACIARLGHIPNLTTYRQMAIRQYKAKNATEALWWAERGIALYGNQARWPENLDDLRQRATTYKARIETQPSHAEGPRHDA